VDGVVPAGLQASLRVVTMAAKYKYKGRALTDHAGRGL